MKLRIVSAWILIAALIVNLILFGTKIISNQIFWINIIILAAIAYFGFNPKRT